MQTAGPRGRRLGGTEHSWCRAVPGGTGIVALGILCTFKLTEGFLSHLESSLRRIQSCNPIIKSKLRWDTSAKTFTFVQSSALKIKVSTLLSTLKLLEDLRYRSPNVSSLHLLVEHELNLNSWVDDHPKGNEVAFATIYELQDSQNVIVLRFHVSTCDRTTGVALLNQLLDLIAEEKTNDVGENQADKEDDLSFSIEELIPAGMTKKSIWARGVDVLSYSMNSFRLNNLPFKDTKSPRSSQVVRLQLDGNHTQKIISECESRGIKLCGALAAAGLLAASKSCFETRPKKYGIITLTDCRSTLKPQLASDHFGFYHSAILNTHAVKRGEKLWDVAKRCYQAFANSKENKKHYTDMADLNFLMVKAIDNPGLTSSSSLRTSLLSIFEDTVIDNLDDVRRRVCVEDYMGCASVHGIGPSIGIFDTIRDGCLDCVCVYPSPLHSREQMVELIGDMKRILELAV